MTEEDWKFVHKRLNDIRRTFDRIYDEMNVGNNHKKKMKEKEPDTKFILPNGKEAVLNDKKEQPSK